MPSFLHHFIRFFFHLGIWGPLVLGTLDSSFLFVPIGNDLLVVALAARHHDEVPIYIVMAACGSALGVFFLDLVARKVGEEGVQRVTGRRRFAFLKRKIAERGMHGLILASLAPPPFPFTMLVATTSALGYPRRRLILTVGLSRAVRFTILSLLAIRFGRQILHVVNLPAFKWTMVGFIVICLIASVFSIANWVRSSRTAYGRPVGAKQPA